MYYRSHAKIATRDGINKIMISLKRGSAMLAITKKTRISSILVTGIFQENLFEWLDPENPRKKMFSLSLFPIRDHRFTGVSPPVLYVVYETATYTSIELSIEKFYNHNPLMTFI